MGSSPPVRAVRPDGRSLAGVRIYTGDLQPGWGGWSYVGETNASGTQKSDRIPQAFLGIAPDGKLAVCTSGRRLVFGPTGTIRLHLTDNHGRALANKLISLFPAEADAPLSATGVMRPLANVPPSVAEVLSRVTNAYGDAEYPNLPKGAPFMVLVQSEDKENALALAGAVKAGQTATVTVANDLQVAGRLTSAQGAPVEGATLVLENRLNEWYDDSIGMAIAFATTDRSGAYRFDNLPNCRVNVRVDLSNMRGVIQSRVNGAAWSEEGYGGPALPKLSESEPNAILGVKWHTGTTLPLKRSTVCDFRMFNPAILTIDFAKPKNVLLNGYSVFVTKPTAGSGAGSGEDVEGRAGVPLVLSPGKHKIYISRFAEDAKHVLAEVDVREGENKRFRAVLPKSFELKPVAPGAGAQNRASMMSNFKAKGSDGRSYDLASLTAGGPVFLVNLSNWNKQMAYSDMNRLARMLAGKVRVVGVTTADTREILRVVKRHRVKFLLLGEEELLVQQFGVGYNSRNVYELANALVLPAGRMTHIWAGYNRSTLRQMEIDLRRTTGKKLALDLSKFPQRLRVGEFSMYGLAGP